MKNNPSIKYRYYNKNPDGKHIEDCVCRAISTAIGLNYGTVDRLLTLTAKFYGCDKLCVCCYHNLLEDIFGYERKVCKSNETVEDIANRYSNDRVIIRIDAHLTSSIKGTVYDIWDCSHRYVDCFWVVK